MNRAVLLIEDNEQNVYLMTYLLEHHRYRVVSALNGRRGLEVAAGSAFDVILLDIELPDMSGYAVARSLRNLAACPPIVAVTSHALPGDRERVLEAGCQGYLEKPITPSTFIADMERFAGLAQ